METYDPKGSCIKCGHGDIGDAHFKGFNPDEQLVKIKTQHIPEHIARVCKNCSYSWDEKPLNNESIPLIPCNIITCKAIQHVVRESAHFNTLRHRKLYMQWVDQIINIGMRLCSEGYEDTVEEQIQDALLLGIHIGLTSCLKDIAHNHNIML